MLLEKYLIENCAPTLASLKTANLFCTPLGVANELEDHVAAWNRQLSKKGLSLQILRKRGNRALIYVYRKTRLEADFMKPGVADFLAQYGYDRLNTEDALSRLRNRLKNCDGFPHEIGIFLGYPLGDVIGFIQNEGKNSKCTGCWKVYCNEYEALKLFARFKRCREIYGRLWHEGKTIWQLTVTA